MSRPEEIADLTITLAVQIKAFCQEIREQGHHLIAARYEEAAEELFRGAFLLKRKYGKGEE